MPDEATGFHLPDGATVWYHDTEDHYEGTYMRRALKGVPPGGWLAPPVTYALPQGGGFALHQDAFRRRFCGQVQSVKRVAGEA